MPTESTRRCSPPASRRCSTSPCTGSWAWSCRDPADPSAGIWFPVAGPAQNQAACCTAGSSTRCSTSPAFLALIPLLSDAEHAVTHDLTVSLLRPVPRGRAGGRQPAPCCAAAARSRSCAPRRRVDGEVVAAAQVTKSVVRAAADHHSDSDRVKIPAMSSSVTSARAGGQQPLLLHRALDQVGDVALVEADRPDAVRDVDVAHQVGEHRRAGTRPASAGTPASGASSWRGPDVPLRRRPRR